MEEACMLKDAECLAKIARITEQLELWQAKHDRLVQEHELALVALEEDLRQRLEAEKASILLQLQQTQVQLEKSKKDYKQALTDKDAALAELRHEWELLLD